MPRSLFENFSLEYDAQYAPVLKSAVCKKSGELPAICAHRPEKNITVTYHDILHIETSSGNTEFRGEQLAVDSYAVTFRPDVRVALRDGTLLLPQPPEDKALTRVTYYNLSRKDFLSLAFLRSKADRLLFIGELRQTEILLRIASHNTEADGALAAAAYERAVSLLEKAQGIDADSAEAFCGFLSTHLHSPDHTESAALISDFRRVDRTGEAALMLAALLHERRRAKALVTAIIEESIARLVARKPRGYSAHLCAILDFVVEEKLSAPPPAQLLWQAYLAASAERAVGALRKIFLRAKSLKADEETLEMIYKTWRGFVGSDTQVEHRRGRLKQPASAIKKISDQGSGNAG